MNQEQFIGVLKEVVRDQAIKNTLKNLTAPAGRKPDPELVSASKWFASLDEESKTAVQAIIKIAVDDSVFGFLAVIDGVRQIEDDFNKGDLELYFVKGSDRILLNDPKKEMLHDLFSDA